MHIRLHYVLPLTLFSIMATFPTVATVADTTNSVENPAQPVASTPPTLTTAKKHLQKTAKVDSSKAPKSLAEAATTGQLDIIGTVDAPMQSNILSWQEIEGKAPKNNIEFSALKDALIPTDRDRLTNEVRYSQILNHPEK